jgi:hypothetical protein
MSILLIGIAIISILVVTYATTVIDNIGITTTSISTTSLTVALVNNTAGYVQMYRLLVENGTVFPATVSNGYLFFRTDYNTLCFYNGTDWSNCTISTDLSAYMLKDGTTALTANWNLGGSFGVYGATWLNSTQINADDFWWNSQNRTDVMANPTETASYIVDSVGSTYRLKNGTTGQIDYQSTTDVGAVVNNAFGNLTYGLIHVKAGDYTQLTRINAKGRVTLEGDGMYSTQFILGNSVNDDMIRWAPTATEQFFELKDICFDGNKAQNTAGMGINFTGNTYDFTAYRVWIYNAPLDGFYIRNNAWGLRCYGLTIETCGRIGLNMTDNSNCASFFGCRFASNTGSGVDLGTSSWAKWFFGCEFDSNGGCGIKIRGGNAHQIIGGRITSNTDDGCEVWGSYHYFEGTYIASNTQYGIDIHGTSCEIQYCQFASNVAGQVNPGGTTMVIHYCLGFVTENSVSSANTTATTAVIAHGLASTATFVWCSFSSSAITGYTWSSNSTHITITPTGTLPASWTTYAKVEYKP